MKKKELKLSGGALVEGVMIKKEGQYAMALRKGNSDIEIIHDVYKGILGRGSFAKIPILRGIFALIDNLALTIKTFLFSSDYYEDNSKEDPGFIQKFLKKFTGKYHESVEMIACITLALILSIGGFIVLPYWLSEKLADICIPSTVKMVVVETVLRVAMILIYVVIFCMTKDIRKISRYHGAQHKVLNCLEKGEELTLANVRRASKFDRKCEISFLLSVFLVSFVLFAFIRSDDIWIRMALRVGCIPVVAAIFYELKLIMINTGGPISALLQVPSRFMQKLYTVEPTEDMIEVAIESLQAVFDWRDYLGLPSLEEDPTYSSYDYVDNVSAGRGTGYMSSEAMQENMYSNNYYNEGSYNNESYNYNMGDLGSATGYARPEYDNLGYEDYNNGQYFVESKGAHNPQYTDINNVITRQPIDDVITKQPGYNDDYSMYGNYGQQQTGYEQNYAGYGEYGQDVQYTNMPQTGMYNQGNYGAGYGEDDDLKRLDRYFNDDNY